MSWDSKDSARQQSRKAPGLVGSRRSLTPAVATGTELGGVLDAMPVEADTLFWDAAGDPRQDYGVSQEEARELAAMGMLNDRQWSAWSKVAKRGVTEV